MEWNTDMYPGSANPFHTGDLKSPMAYPGGSSEFIEGARVLPKPPCACGGGNNMMLMHAGLVVFSVALGYLIGRRTAA